MHAQSTPGDPEEPSADHPIICQDSAVQVSGDREVQRTMLELLNQLDGFSSDENIKVRWRRKSAVSLHASLLDALA